jgi:hypothetical protein
MKSMIAIPVMCLAMSVEAACTVSKPREQPVIPDASVATEQEMYRAQLSVEEYVRRGELYLECGYMNRRQYNRFLSQLELVAEQYNRELGEYQSRMRLVADTE